MSNINRWLEWTPRERISANSPYREPTKPSEPGFEGFDGTVSAQVTDIQLRSGPNSGGLEQVRKGRAVALDCAVLGETIWFVADEEDARLLGELRGSVYTASEAVSVACVARPETIGEIHRWKREFNATITEAHKLSG